MSQESSHRSRSVLLRGIVLIAMAIGLGGLNSSIAMAHKPSDSYVRIDATGEMLTIQWDIALKDLELILGLDGDRDGVITWGEVRQQGYAIAAHAGSRLTLSADGISYPLAATDLLFDRHSDGGYAVLVFETQCPSESPILNIDYDLMFDIDPTHRGLLNYDNGLSQVTGIIGPGDSPYELDTRSSALVSTFVRYLIEGVRHIWLGFDHVLFLVTLMLPAVLFRRRGKWHPALNFRNVAGEVLKLVTFFTIAHSITLWLAVTETVSLPGRPVEACIAVSIIFAAALNLSAKARVEGAWVAFVFGLIHGFGFASVLSELGLTRSTLGSALFGFNVGVELGQLAIVAVILPIAYHYRAHPRYQPFVLRRGSIVIALLASVWLVERVFNLDLIPF